VLSFDTDEDEETETAETATATTSPSSNTAVDDKKLNKTASAAKAMLDDVKEKAKQVAQIFSEGFKKSLDFGNVNQNFDNIKKQCADIGNSVKNILNDGEIQKNSSKLAGDVITTLGEIGGAAVSIGTSLADFFTGSVAKYIAQDADYIKERINGTVKAADEGVNTVGRFAIGLATIFTAFDSEAAKNMGANLLGIFSNAFLGILELATKFTADILSCILDPITNNADKIKEALEKLFEPLETVFGTINDSVKETFEKLNEMYDEHIHPFFQSISDGFTEILGMALDWFNSDFAPMLNRLADLFDSVYKEHIQPMINECINLIGKLFDSLKKIWEKCIKPLIEWCVQNILPKITPILETMGTVFMTLMGNVADVVKGILQYLGGLIDFITGVLTGDWEQAFTGMKEMAEGKINAVKGIIESLITLIKGDLSIKLELLKSTFTTVFEGAKAIVKKSVDYIKSLITALVDKVKQAGESLKNLFSFGKSGATANVQVSGSIPKFATGGVINQPTLAMVGENGKEAVMPLENNTGWIDELAMKLATIMSAGKSAAQPQNQPIYIELDIGGTKFGKVCIDSINSQQRRAGKILLNV
jgi:phage-related protein